MINQKKGFKKINLSSKRETVQKKERKFTDSTMAENMNMESSATSTNSSNSYVIRGQIFEGDYQL